MTTDIPCTLEIRLERVIGAAPAEVFDAWLDPKVPGTTWHAADKLMLDPRPDGMFFWRMNTTGTPHYGRFTRVERGSALEHTWVSPNTLGRESRVSVSFASCTEGTRMVLTHSGLPDNEQGRRHEQGWNYFLGLFRGPAEEPS
jgi:uncharacterized protein YndB with AHSA1/START domain